MKYTSEDGIRIPRIVVKSEEHKDKKGKQYFVNTIKVAGETEDEVIETLNSLRKKLGETK
jgi:hypothetical protein